MPHVLIEAGNKKQKRIKTKDGIFQRKQEKN